MNEKAGRKALLVPDFSSAVKYTESALSFLDDSYWLSHRDLMLNIHQTSVAALYSNKNSNQDLLKERIDLVFRYARNLDEEFRTRLVWIEWMSSSSLKGAINECHVLLERLGEPIDPSSMSINYAHSELVRIRETFFERNEQLSGQIVDPNRAKAMKVMMHLSNFYFKQKSFMMLVIVCTRMVELSSKYGCSEYSTFALALLAMNLNTYLGDIDRGCSWARLALDMLSKNHYDAVLPEVVSLCSLRLALFYYQFSYLTFSLQYAAVYGFVLWWKEPLQASANSYEPMQGSVAAYICLSYPFLKHNIGYI